MSGRVPSWSSAGASISAAPAEQPSSRHSWGGLIVLILLGLYTYMDRHVIALQAEPIRQQLGLGDFQFGLLQGASVALVTAIVGYPIAWLADHSDRRLMLAGCLVVWCLAVAACGAADSFGGLAAASALVGVAEAGLIPIAYAAIPEWFRATQRHAANSTYMLLGRLSAGVIIALCGWLIHSIDAWRPLLPEVLQTAPTWRLALWATALPGIVLLALIGTLPPMPARADFAVRRRERGARMPAEVFARGGVFMPIFLGGGLLSLGANAMGAFIPVVAARAWGLGPLQAGQAFGAAALAGAAGALVTTLALTRVTRAAERPETSLRIAAWSMAGAAAAALAMPLTDRVAAYFVLYGVALVFTMSSVMLLPTALQPLSPGPQRVRIMSLFVAATIVMGAIGPAAVGALSDALGASASMLLGSMCAVAVMAHTAAAAVLARGATRAPIRVEAL